jgi:hypothetical protein
LSPFLLAIVLILLGFMYDGTGQRLLPPRRFSERVAIYLAPCAASARRRGLGRIIGRRELSEGALERRQVHRQRVAVGLDLAAHSMGENRPLLFAEVGRRVRQKLFDEAG